jgi:predicted small lipoprotein YifL
MTRLRITTCLLLGCLLLALSACGNKGPLVLPKKEEPQKTTSATE